MTSQIASAPVKSAMRTLDILELAAGRSGPVTAHEIAITLGIPVSSLSYLLSTLVEGYRWSALAVLGGLLAIAGLFIALRTSRRDAQNVIPAD